LGVSCVRLGGAAKTDEKGGEDCVFHDVSHKEIGGIWKSHGRDKIDTSWLADRCRLTDDRPMQPTDANLLGKLLIAMPEMGDPRFEHSVIYICAHSKEGAMGLIVNKPQSKLRFSKLLEQLDISADGDVKDVCIHYGGPVEMARGFVVHTSDYRSEMGTLDVDGRIGMTATIDVLEDIAKGDGPATSMLALGYAGWGAGQLEGEIMRNGWLTCDPTDAIVFGRANEHKWTAALKILGVDPLMLSSTAGHA
jgi:putative transcriptional regulator